VNPLGIIFIVALAGGLAWINILRRETRRLHALVRQAQLEQEAVLSFIDKIGEKITSDIDLDETLDIIARYIVNATQAESGAIFLVNEEEQTLQARVVVGPFPLLHESQEHVLTKPKYLTEKIKKDPIKIGEGIVGQVAEQGEPLLVTDAKTDPRVPHHASMLSEVDTIMLCPLRVREEVLGVLVVVNKQGEEQFNDRNVALLQVLADQAAVTTDLVKLYDVLSKQKRLEQELKVAYEFQKMLLPRKFPCLPGYELHAMSEAATVVGGDYFDFFEVDEDSLGLVIADVSGKGIPGALIMAMVRAVLRAEARGNLSPKEVLSRVNERILSDTKENVFITMTYGILNYRTGVLRFIRAGHEPLLIFGAHGGGKVTQLAPEGIALGLVDDEIFDHNEQLEIQLHPGEIVLLYTDGVIEAMDKASSEYSRERLITKMEAVGDGSAKGLIEAVVEDIHQFTLGNPQHDDITMLAIRVLASEVARWDSQS